MSAEHNWGPEVNLISTMLVVNGPYLNDFQKELIPLVLGAAHPAATGKCVELIKKELDAVTGRAPNTTTSTNTTSPPHYGRFPMPPIWFLKIGGWSDVFIFNAVKYLFRYLDKDDPGMDLRKAIEYLEMRSKFQKLDPEWFR